MVIVYESVLFLLTPSYSPYPIIQDVAHVDKKKQRKTNKHTNKQTKTKHKNKEITTTNARTFMWYFPCNIHNTPTFSQKSANNTN